MRLTSSAFDNGGMIPEKYTCDGEDISPPLKWDGLPAACKELALICDDPDAPMGVWVHWVIYHIPPQVKELTEHVAGEKKLSNGAVQGINDFRSIGYGGPSPPGGTHRYFFKLYALNANLDLEAGAGKTQLVKAMQGHVLEETQLMGKYKRN